jgi:hypothetical protein
MNPILLTQKQVPTLRERVAFNLRREKQVNKNRNKLNQPPTGQGKKQSPRSGAANKLSKRAEVLQAASAEQNMGTAEEEEGLRSRSNNPKRPKAGR